MSLAFLQIRRGDAPPRVVGLLGTRMVAGRSPEVEIVLESDTVSRQHMELVKDESGHWWVRDLHSRNGTIVNGARVNSHRLSFGDVIQVEDYFLTFSRSPSEAAGARSWRISSIAVPSSPEPAWPGRTSTAGSSPVDCE